MTDVTIGQTWLAKIPGLPNLIKVKIKELTTKVVGLDTLVGYGYEGDTAYYKLNDVEFIEQVLR